MRVGCIGWVVLCFCAVSNVAHADDESDRAAAERLSAIAHDQAALDGKARTAIIGGLIAGGVVATAIGVPLLVDALSHPNPMPSDVEAELGGGVFLTAFGGAALVSWPLAFIHTPAERLDNRIQTLATLAPHDRLVRVEALFEAAAEEERSTRRNGAIVSFVLAALNVAIVPIDILAGNRWLAGVNGGAAVIAIVGGAIQLGVAGPMERAWRTWLVGTGRSPTVSVVPTPTGVALRF